MKYRFFAYLMLFLFSIIVSSCTKEKILKKEEKTLKKVPVIIWANPADISVGELLSDKQLNATTDVAGDFCL